MISRGEVLAWIDRAREQLLAAVVELDALVGRLGVSAQRLWNGGPKHVAGGREEPLVRRSERAAGLSGKPTEENAAISVSTPNTSAAEAVGDLMALVGQVYDFCENRHFPVEDALLDLVIEQGITPSERRALFVNLAQHQELHAAATAVLGLLTSSPMSAGVGMGTANVGRPADRVSAGKAFTNGAPTTNLPGVAVIREAGGRYAVQLRRHLDFEQAFVEPLLVHYLSGGVLDLLRYRHPSLFDVLSLPPGGDLVSWPRMVAANP